MYVNQSNLMAGTSHYIKSSHTPLSVIIEPHRVLKKCCVDVVLTPWPEKCFNGQHCRIASDHCSVLQNVNVVLLPPLTLM